MKRADVHHGDLVVLGAYEGALNEGAEVTVADARAWRRAGYSHPGHFENGTSGYVRAIRGLSNDTRPGPVVIVQRTVSGKLQHFAVNCAHLVPAADWPAIKAARDAERAAAAREAEAAAARRAEARAWAAEGRARDTAALAGLVARVEALGAPGKPGISNAGTAILCLSLESAGRLIRLAEIAAARGES